jgi:hypothetical protein
MTLNRKHIWKNPIGRVQFLESSNPISETELCFGSLWFNYENLEFVISAELSERNFNMCQITAQYSNLNCPVAKLNALLLM